MATYLVTSDRLVWARGATVHLSELAELDINVQALIDAGHLSPQNPNKSAKPTDNETKE